MNTGLKNVLAFVSDNAVYMKKCFNDSLEAILPNAVHVTCWAHIVFPAGAQFRSALQLTDNVVALVKEMFSKAPGRRARCLNHRRQLNAGQISLPPVPVITRRKTSFQVVLYHGEHLEHHMTFVVAENEHGSTRQLCPVN